MIEPGTGARGVGSLAVRCHDRLTRRLSDRRLARPDAAAAALLARLVRGPLPYSASSMRLSSIQTLCNLVAVGDPRNVVELGPGSSTLVVASLLEEMGSGGRVVAVEHDETWMAVVDRLATRWGVRERVDLVLAPLKPWVGTDGGLQVGRWYDSRILGERLPSMVDLLVVDGPPAFRYEDRLARYPALPELLDRLGPDSVVVLDDLDRWGERRVFRRWRHAFGSQLTFERITPTSRTGIARGSSAWTV